jgi:hypothetical protein
MINTLARAHGALQVLAKKNIMLSTFLARQNVPRRQDNGVPPWLDQCHNALVSTPNSAGDLDSSTSS